MMSKKECLGALNRATALLSEAKEALEHPLEDENNPVMAFAEIIFECQHQLNSALHATLHSVLGDQGYDDPPSQGIIPGLEPPLPGK